MRTTPFFYERHFNWAAIFFVLLLHLSVMLALAQAMMNTVPALKEGETGFELHSFSINALPSFAEPAEDSTSVDALKKNVSMIDSTVAVDRNDLAVLSASKDISLIQKQEDIVKEMPKTQSEKKKMVLEKRNTKKNLSAQDKKKPEIFSQASENTNASQLESMSHAAVLSEKDIHYLKKPNPVYPRVSLKRQEQGVVIVLISLREDGQPVSAGIEHSSGHASLDNAALNAAKAARFKPYLQNGTPLRVKVRIPISFSMVKLKG